MSPPKSWLQVFLFFFFVKGKTMTLTPIHKGYVPKILFNSLMNENTI